MEATGVYWMPVWKILSDGDFALIVANAAHIKNVPGRKTDLNDAMWIADLMACGLINASFVPEEDLQELRSLMRSRKQLTREQTRHVQRIQKTLTEANIRLDSVICDIMGASGRRIIEAMIAGVRDPHRLAALASKRVKATPQELHDALHGRLTDHHRFLLKLHLRQCDALDAAIRDIDGQVDAQISRMDQQLKAATERGAKAVPFRELIKLLCTIPGVSVLAATMILAEIGRDMSRFPTAGHLCAWAGLAPASHESAGKRRPAGTRQGAPWLRRTLIEAARAAARTKGSYFSAQYSRLARRRGPNKAAVAVAHSILETAWHLLSNGELFVDPGASYFERRHDPAREAKRLQHRIESLGYTVTLTENAA
jgi:transposase